MKPKQNTEARLRVDFSEYTNVCAGRVLCSFYLVQLVRK